ncbi:methylmalonyl-CoA mutase family protein [Alkalihalobacterium chitinilyticum]|uniref:Acyl-CoA mutase large subunit family protein n=1 Tax=Alkalihalobacterium chitinilyticum TaxID=2980103 RepID=A0ABT5VAP8_9BACI|nr:methylmalonyl-CoA mutase family protein [Alkalihalobacterium chitinilyticum]MDE5412523.1 acyl-CoA mutase large subunit family protein [Alkalihalobacterium chitinilyticum]
MLTATIMEDKKALEPFWEFPVPSYDEWRQVTEKSLKGASFEKKLVTKTYEGISLQPMYQQKDTQDLPFIDSLPGQSPFLRGAGAVPSKEKAWEISQELTTSTPKQFNLVAKHDLARGQTVLNIVLDEVTKKGLNIEEAKQMVGQSGLNVTSVEDMKTAIEDIDLANIPVHIHAGANSLPVLAVLVGAAKNNNIEVSQLQGVVGMDPIGQLVENGSIEYSLEECYNVMADTVKWSTENAPSLQTVLVEGTPYHNGGSSAVEELAFSLATGVEYLQALTSRGVSVKDAAKSIRFVFSVGSDYFMEISKLRAARILWSKIVTAFGGEESDGKLTIHARTSSWTKTKYDPYVNMLRTTSEAFAAAVGGANSIHVSPFDEPIQKSTPFSRRIARNISIILQEESHIGQTADPAGGSWYVEVLTNELAEKAWALFQQVEQTGGVIEALKAGMPQQKVAETKTNRLNNISQRKDIFVGTNMYANTTEKAIDVVPEDDTKYIEQYVSEKLNAAVVPVQFTDESNTVEQALQFALNGASVADLASGLGKTESSLVIEPIVASRGAELFEELRQANELHAKKQGETVKVFLANLGPIPSHKARADFTAGFFEVGGFEVIRNNGFMTSAEAAQAAVDSKASVVVICGKDESYQEQAADIAQSIKQDNKEVSVMIAGKPAEEDEVNYRNAGVDEFVHLRSNCYEVLRKLQVEKGVVKG